MDINRSKNIKNIRHMSFPDNDFNWTDVIKLIESNELQEKTILAAVEFCSKFDNCVPYEWSYWQSLDNFDCVVLHKGMLDRLKDGYLDNIDEQYDYIYGNSVFNVYVKSSLNINNLKGNAVHFSINSLIHGLKRVLKINKQYKAKGHKKNILLVTANHSGNIGDDAITLASKDILEAAYPEANVVIDKGPASKELIRKVDLVVLGGGGIFYDSNFYNAQNYCQYLLYAHEANVKSIGIGIGAQGIKTKLGKELYKYSVNLMEFILVRDEFSKQMLVENVGTDTEVILSRDVCFSLKGKNSNYKINRRTEKPILLFSLLDTSKMLNAKATVSYRDNQSSCMKLLNEKFEVKLFVQSRDDLDLYKELKDEYGLDIIELGFNSTKEVCEVYKQADLVLTSRLHGFIFSAISRVPVIPAASYNKNTKLGNLIFRYIPSAQRGMIMLKDYSVEKLKEKINDFESDKKQFILKESEVRECEMIAENIVNILRDNKLDF